MLKSEGTLSPHPTILPIGVYALSGLAADGSKFPNVSYVFDATSAKWTEVPRTLGNDELPGIARAGSVEVDGKLWFAGGETIEKASSKSTFSKATTSVRIFDPATSTWSKGAELPEGLTRVTLFKDLYGRVLISGIALEDQGANEVYVKKLYRIDPQGKAKEWKSRLELPGEGADMAAISHKDGVIVGPVFDSETGERSFLRYGA